ncbi:ragulator complex protein LAMTOR4 [Aplysia californica]|uniref:Late endosomal/lysosomal adaptor and MAPK and MTOR activator 4 n=1 Tax=Aplysia californica TaxID=6500 RepID=A0ABM0KB02_APLCA|nr:ragulator complex protein LAMTOR4 [Aplysia californica]
MATYGMDRVPDYLGYLVLAEDGAVISSGGELENDESTANKLNKLIHTACRIPITPDKKDVLRRMSIVVDDVIFMVTVSQHKIFVSKRQYNPQEPVST